MNNVLEHLPDVRVSISKCEVMLNSSGYLYIAVFDADNFYKHVDEPFYEFSLEDINFFSASALRKILINFEKVKTVSDGRVIFSLWKKSSDTVSAIKKYVELSNKKCCYSINSFRIFQKSIWLGEQVLS